MKNDVKYDCDKNPTNIPGLFRDKDHLEQVVQLVLSHPSVDESREKEIRLAAQCDDFGILSNSLDENIEGYSDVTLVETLVNYAKKR